MTETYLPVIAALVLLAFMALVSMRVLVDDPSDTLIRAVRTAVQAGLGVLVATLVSGDLDLSIVLNVATPAMIGFATVLHAAVQPAERQEPEE